MTPQEIIDLNILRVKNLNALYDPIRGVGSLTQRFKFTVGGMSDRALYLPETMKKHLIIKCLREGGSLTGAAKLLELSQNEVLSYFQAIRCTYDFEFWAAFCVKIKTKTHSSVPFILNYPQRILLKELERQRSANIPIRIILLKHRQWGGSTLTQLYIAWIQLFLEKGRNALIVGETKDQAKNILEIYSKMLRMHPPEIFQALCRKDSLNLTSYGGSSNSKIITERDSVISVGTAQRPEANRSFTVHFLHLSEVGSWKSNQVVNAEDLVQSLYGALVDEPLTLCVKESTAQGVGNYFHREWCKAIRKESNDAPVFIEWFKDMQYTIDPLSLNHITSTKQFIETWNADEQSLFGLGASVEHIAWRRIKIKDYSDLWRFQQEFPSTPDEAFTSTSRRVFALEYVKRARRNCRVPLAIGELCADSQKGTESLKNIHFTAAPGGNLSVWIYPHRYGIEKPNMLYTNRYCAFADVGGSSAKADYSVVTILDRMPTILSGVPIVAAEFHGHLDQDLFAWYAARLCSWYGNALLAIEVNSLHTDRGDDERGYSPEHSFTVLDQIKEHYDNLYYRQQPQQLQNRWDGVIGFHMNKQTKPMVIDALRASLRDEEYEERNILACDEFDTYQEYPDGSMGAVEGFHDDRVISRAGAIWLSNSMDPVKEINREDRNRLTGHNGHVARF